MRLAGTCSRYSNRAIPQLTSAATTQGRVFNSLRWPYQAKVMKTFDIDSSATVCSKTTALVKAPPMSQVLKYRAGLAPFARLEGHEFPCRFQNLLQGLALD